MGELPKVSIVAAPTWQRERLAAWLREWRIQCMLGENEWNVSAAGSPQPKGPPDQASQADGESPSDPPRIGQIRLLHPCYAVGARRPVYVAVLAQQTSHSFLVVPYGRFSEPAVPGELLTGRSSGALRVLCAWNAFILTMDILMKSWVVDEMSDKELDDARLVLESLVTCGPPDRIAHRVGPPLVHPADPRYVYKDEEAEWAADLAAGSLHELPHSGLTYDLPARGPLELPKAAEPGEEYGDENTSGRES